MVDGPCTVLGRQNYKAEYPEVQSLRKLHTYAEVACSNEALIPE